ncbi:hypothetical protein B7494_g251 [Chlorociboria aeruginascens]|nr:hypothetical protein B7494_g251 [Chlorociboria aeruginascens]
MSGEAKPAASGAVNPNLSANEIASFKEVFALFDSDGDGEISKAELGAILKSLGLDVSDVEINDMVNEVDIDNSGSIDLEEFIKMMTIETKPVDFEQEMRSAFKVFDIDGSGTISAEEIYKIMGSFGEKLSDEELKTMIDEVDKDGNGTIDYEEFVSFFLDKQSFATQLRRKFEVVLILIAAIPLCLLVLVPSKQCMALSIPTTLQLKHLKAICAKCGLSSTGTKAILTSRLHNEISPLPFSKPHLPTRILSIDMGIRNLAFCALDIPHALPSPVPVPKSWKEGIMPTVQAWERLAISKPPEGGGEIGMVKESFSAATLSEKAYELVKEKLLPLNPKFVLIERQRFRSMGSPAIFEWTLRVNTLESILHGIFHTLRKEGIWDGEVIKVLPGRVGPFWLGGGEEVEKSTIKLGKTRLKGLKIDLVRKWLGNGEVVKLGNKQVEYVAKRYMDKWDGVRAKRKKAKIVDIKTKEGILVRKEGREPKEAVEAMGKLDDLADCLLQGMAWKQWQDNQRAVVQIGVEALLDEPVAPANPVQAKKPVKPVKEKQTGKVRNAKVAEVL